MQMMWFRPLTQTLAVETTPANVVVAVFEFVDDDDDVVVVVYVGVELMLLLLKLVFCQ